jgi:hypothetical protein
MTPDAPTAATEASVNKLYDKKNIQGWHGRIKINLTKIDKNKKYDIL